MHEYRIHTLQQLAFALRDRRKQKGKTQVTAGSEVGVLPKTVSALETKPGPASIGSLFKLLSALNLELVLRPKESRTSDKATQPDW